MKEYTDTKSLHCCTCSCSGCDSSQILVSTILKQTVLFKLLKLRDYGVVRVADNWYNHQSISCYS